MNKTKSEVRSLKSELPKAPETVHLILRVTGTERVISGQMDPAHPLIIEDTEGTLLELLRRLIEKLPDANQATVITERSGCQAETVIDLPDLNSLRFPAVKLNRIIQRHRTELDKNPRNS